MNLRLRKLINMNNFPTFYIDFTTMGEVEVDVKVNQPRWRLRLKFSKDEVEVFLSGNPACNQGFPGTSCWFLLLL